MPTQESQLQTDERVRSPEDDTGMFEQFQKELTPLINKCGIDNRMNVHDFVLSRYIIANLLSLTNLKFLEDALKSQAKGNEDE